MKRGGYVVYFWKTTAQIDRARNEVFPEMREAKAFAREYSTAHPAQRVYVCGRNDVFWERVSYRAGEIIERQPARDIKKGIRFV